MPAMRAPRPHVTPGALACRSRWSPRCFTVINDEKRQRVHLPTVSAIVIRSSGCRRPRSSGRVAVGAAPQQPVGSGLGVSAEGQHLDNGTGGGANGDEDQREPELSGGNGGILEVLDMEDDDDFDTEEEEDEEEEEEEDDGEYVDEDDSLVAGMDGDLSDLDPYEDEEVGSPFVRREGGGVAAVEELLAERGADLSLERINRIFPYTLDKFQARAVAEILGGRNALVCAPTGAGKTAIAVAAAAAMLAQGLRVVYTTPLKALSNQKFFELGEMFGTGRVGLRTGDSTVNANADVVVMTTEILRNAMFSDDNDSETGAPQMLNVGLIVLDEVHYLGDKDRGSVWEEVIIACPDNVLMLAMSATVQNPKDVGGWISGVHQPCSTIRTSFRPVPLKWHFCFSASAGMERTRIVPLLDEVSKRKDSSKQLRLNPELLPPPQRRRARLRAFAAKWVGGNGGSRRSVLGDADELLRQAASIEMEEEEEYEDGQRAWLEPRRNSVVREMAKMDMLPAIWFIFSRKGCDDAVRMLHEAGVVLTTAEERADIDAAAAAVRNEQPEAVREGLLSSLRAGLAAHHAGLLPAWKGLVESLFQRGLLKVVFATSTLAAGINMPARTTVISSLSLRRGSDRFTMLPHNELLQMAGRAGRRGFDTIGHCIILKSRHERVEDALDILRAGPEPLESQFTTSYGMVLNLIATRPLSECRTFVQQSFRAYLNSRTFSEERATIKKLEQQVDALMGKGTPGVEDEKAEMLREHQKLKALVKQERRGLKVLRIEAAKLRGAQVVQQMQQLTLPALVLLDTQVTHIRSHMLPAYCVGRSWDDHKDDDPRWLCLAADNRLYICTSQHFAGRGGSVAEGNPAHEEADGEPNPIISSTYRVAESASTSWKDHSGGMRASAGTVATAQLALQLSSYEAPVEAPLPDGYTEAIEEQRRRYDVAKAQQRELRRSTKGKAGMRELRTRIRRAERLKQRAAALSSALERQAGVGWQSFESVVEVLEEMGAVEKLDNGEYRLLPLGNAARELRCENELWLALCMLHPAVLPLTPPQFAGLIGALLMPDAINRPNVWAAYDCTPPVIAALEALDSTMESFTLVQKRASIDKPVEVDLRLAGVVEAWADGCEWSEIMQDMSLDDGDVARLLNRICDVLRQLTYVDVLAAEQRQKARTALKAMDRKPISEFVFTSAARNLASAL